MLRALVWNVPARQLVLAAVTTLLAVSLAHPSSLECGTDATTRLVPGRAMVMQVRKLA